MKCDNCGNWNDTGSRHCTNCGTAISEKKICSQGHTIPPTLQDCPWCPKPSTVARPATQVEKVCLLKKDLPTGQNHGVEPFSNTGTNRAGTVVLGPNALPSGSGGLGAPVPLPSAPEASPTGGSYKRNRTMVATPGQGIGATVPVPSQVAAGASNAGSRGASPLAGFLVSFSTDPNGVFWPLRMGRTRLGSGEDSDIQLAYSGISGNHANINVHNNKGGLKIWITDQDSMNGTRLNGDNIFNDKPDLSNGDQVGIGDVVMQLILLPGNREG